MGNRGMGHEGLKRRDMAFLGGNIRISIWISSRISIRISNRISIRIVGMPTDSRIPNYASSEEIQT